MMAAGGLWALDTSNSFGRSPSALRSSLDASQLSLQNDSLGSASKVATALRGSPSALSTSASFHGSGISDLRAAVVSQQKQFDGFVDKMAALLAAMHAELTNDLRKALEGETNGRLEELRRAGSDLDSRLSQISLRLGELREAESRDCSVAQLKGEQERQELREQLSRELQLAGTRFGGEVQALHEHMDSEARAMHERLTGGLEDLQGQLSGKVDRLEACLNGDLRGFHERLQGLEGSALMADDAEHAWQLSIDHACACLREDLRHELLDGACSHLRARLAALEERVLGAPVPLAPQLPPMSLDAEEGAIGRRRDRFDRLEADARRQDAALERLEEDIRRLRQAEASIGEREAQAQEWQRRTEGRLEASASAEARIALLEQWRKRAEERFERLGGQQQAGPLQGRLGGTEHRVDALHERVESLTALLQQQVRHGSVGAGGGRSVEGRIDEVAERVDALAVAVSQGSRHHGHRGDHIGDKLEALGSRVGGAEAAMESVKKQLSEIRSKQARAASPAPSSSEGPARSLQIQSALGSLAKHLRQDIEAQLSQAAEHSQREAQRLAEELREDLASRLDLTQEASQRQGEELRRELEARLQQVQGSSQRCQEDIRQELEDGAEQAERLTEQLRRELDLRTTQLHSSSQQLTDELREELDARTTQLHTASQRLSDETCQLRHELELRAAQTQGLKQQLATELRQELHALATQHPAAPGPKGGRLEESRLEARLETRLHSQAQSASQKLVGELRQQVEEHLGEVRGSVQRLGEELRRGLREASELRAATGPGGGQGWEEGALVAAAREAAGEAVADLERRLEEPLAERLRRCDAVAENCERRASILEERAAGAMEVSQPAAQQAGGNLWSGGGGLAELAERVSRQEGELEELRRQNAVLREEVEGYMLERKVSRCLAGLERGRSPFGADAPAPSTPPQSGGRAPRKAVSADGVRTAGATARAGRPQREDSSDPHSLSFLQKQRLFDPGAEPGTGEEAAEASGGS